MLLYLLVQIIHLVKTISLERLVISLSDLIHVFFKFQEWIDSCVYNPTYHTLGDVTYYLGYNFVTSQVEIISTTDV